MSQLWSSGGLEVELVLRLLVDVPALPAPLHAGLVALDLEPVVVVLLVDLDVPGGICNKNDYNNPGNSIKC